MESPLKPVILHKLGSMRRHYQDSDEHDVAQKDGHERQQQRRPQEPYDSSRVRQADPPAGTSPTSIAPTMHAAKKRRTSEISSIQSYPYQKSKSFEERIDEDRSAFTILPKTRGEKEASIASNQEEKKKSSQDPEEAGGPIIPRPVASSAQLPSTSTMPAASAASSSAQPHLSPMRYYHQQRYAESISAKSDPPAFQYQYRGGLPGHPTQPDPFGYGYSAGYYYPPQYPRPDPVSARGYPQFPYFQGYEYQQPHQQQHPTNIPTNMMPSQAAAYSQQNLDEYYGGAHTSTPALTYTKKDPPETIKVTESTKGGSGGLVDLSPTLPSPPVEDDRKPAARSMSSGIQESSSRGDQVHADLHDLYAPLPFHDVQSLLMKTPSPPSPSPQFAKAAASHFDPFADTPEKAHARGTSQLPQHSPVVSSSKKRRRGRQPEHFAAAGQSHSASSTPSVARTSRRGTSTESASRRGHSWDRRYNELVSFRFI